MALHRQYLIIGDSFVEGVGATGFNGWAQICRSKLQGIDVDISGEGGDTTETLIKRFPEQRYDVVVIQIGTNDSRYRPSLKRTEVPMAIFIKNLNRLYTLMCSGVLVPDIVFVGLFFVNENRTVPYKEDKVFLNSSLVRYSSAIAKYCCNSSAQFIDLTSIPRDDGLLSDGLHPSDAGHSAIANVVLPQLISHNKGV